MNKTAHLFLILMILFAAAVPPAQTAEFEDGVTQLRWQELQAKKAKVDELSAQIIVFQKRLERERAAAAINQEKIERDYTEMLERDREKAKDQMAEIDRRQKAFEENENLSAVKSHEKIWQDFMQGLELERKKVKDLILLLDQRQKAFDAELQKKRQQDAVTLQSKEDDLKQMTREAERLRLELNQDQKMFEAYLKDMESRPPAEVRTPVSPHPAAAIQSSEISERKFIKTAALLPRENPGNHTAFSARPQRQEYYVEIGDILEVDVWRVPDLSRSVSVRPDGRISMPVVGDLDVVGLNLIEIRELLTEKLSDYVSKPQVSLSVRQFGGRKFIILGEVIAPGVYRFQNDVSLLEAIALAGGFKEHSNSGNIMVIRGDIRKQPQVKLISANMHNVLKRGMLTENISVMPNDIIYIGTDTVGDVNNILKDVVNPFFDTALDYFVLQSASRADHNS